MREKKVTFRDVRLANRGRGRNVSAAPYTFLTAFLPLLKTIKNPVTTTYVKLASSMQLISKPSYITWQEPLELR